jgi:glycosyltransferase involved in cell wall biosynthesis
MPTDGLTVRAAVVDRAQEDERGQDAAELRAIARRENGVNLSVVIPAKNEADNIGWVLARLPACVDEVVLVDGHSTDGTVEAARQARPDITVVLDERPGKGAALRAGFAAARGDFIVMIDADGSMDPREIELFCKRLRDRRIARRSGDFEFVKGSRFTDGGGTSDMTPVRRLGNTALLKLVNRLYGVQFTDLCYGMMAFRRDVLTRLDLQADGFEIETEIIVRAVKSGVVIGEVPSFEAPRLSGESNLNTCRDGLRVLSTVLHERVVSWPPARRSAHRRRARGPSLRLGR